jgi:hypothetical protein
MRNFLLVCIVLITFVSCKGVDSSGGTANKPLSFNEKYFLMYFDTDMIMDKFIGPDLFNGITTPDTSVYNCTDCGVITISGFSTTLSTGELKIEFNSFKFTSSVEVNGKTKYPAPCNAANKEISVTGTITYKHAKDGSTGNDTLLVTGHQDFSGMITRSCDTNLKVTYYYKDADHHDQGVLLEGTLCDDNNVKDISDDMNAKDYSGYLASACAIYTEPAK